MRKLFLFTALLVYLSHFIPLGIDSPWAAFYPAGFIHNGYRGLDFYQVPQGARALLYGETISGTTLLPEQSFTGTRVTNPNVYHPFATIVLGTPLQLFHPDTAEALWHLFKLVSSLGVVLYLLRQYRESRYRVFASCLFFLNMSHFNEIQILQYQSLANVALLLFLHFAEKDRRIPAMVTIAGSLIVKPFFLFGPLIFAVQKRDWRWMTCTGALLAFLTLPFFFHSSASFFFENLWNRAHGKIPAQPDLISLQSALYMYGASQELLRWIQWALIIALVILATDRRYSIPTLTLFALFIWLSFDRLIYEYHFSSLAYVMFFGVLTQKSWQRRKVLLLACLTTLPTLYLPLHIFGLVEYSHPLSLPLWGAVVLARYVPFATLLAVLILNESRNEDGMHLVDRFFEYFWGETETQRRGVSAELQPILSD